MMQFRCHLLALVVVASPPAQDGLNASGGVLIPEQAAIDVRHCDLELAVDPEQRSIRGQIVLRADVVRATGRLALDLDMRLAVSQVRIGGQVVPFEHREGMIWIPLPEKADVGDRLEVTVAYAGEPRVAPNPPWDGGFTWAKSKGGHPWIATSCQGEGADLWWPCKDHPSDKPETFDLRITVPAGLTCASNGTLQSERDNGDGTTTFHWHVANPISNYNVALNIGRYSVIRETYESVSGETFPVFFWVLPEHLERARRALPEFLEHMRFLEEICGPYPFRNEKYGIVETPHLGMEHQTCIAYGNRFRKGPFDYDWLHHHELSHEWWANLITCRDWKDMWLHEGFGTYMQALYIERKHGSKAYRVQMRNNRRGLNNRRPVAPRQTMDSKQIYFFPDGGHDNDIYYKGSWILHTLRWAVGDEAFLAMLRRMAYPDPESEKVTDGSQVRFVDTEDFRVIAEKTCGQELGWFFDVYLRQPALPQLREERRDGRLHLSWDAPAGLPFPMPVAVEIGGRVRRVEMPDGTASIEIAPGQSYDVDPDEWILKKRQKR
jgi:aminopeptidase N